MTSTAPDSGRHLWLFAVLATFVIGMTIRILFAAGFLPVDDAEYARVAAHVLDGTFSWDTHSGPPVNPGRLGVVLPLMGLFWAFGANEVSMATYPLLISLLTAILVCAFATKMFGRVAGLIAAIIWIVVPLDVEYATKVNPDTPVTAFVALGLFTVYCARALDAASRNTLLARGIAAGLAFGVAWLCKASTIYFVPFCLILLAFDLRRDFARNAWLWGGVAAGSLLVFGSEMIYYAITTGDPLYRFFIIEKNYQLYPQFFFNEGAKWGYEVGMPYWKAVAKRVFLEGPETFFLRKEFMFLTATGVMAAAYGWYKRDRRFYFMALLLGSLLFMFNFFSASMTHYQPLPLFARYSHSLSFASVVLTAGLIATLAGPNLSRQTLSTRPDGLFWAASLSLVLAIAGGWNTFREFRDSSTTWSSAEKALAKVVSPSDRIYTDALSRAGLEFFWDYPRSMNIENIADLAPDASIPCGGYVLINASYDKWLTNNFGMWYTFEPFELPKVASNPPPDWEQRWDNGNARLYYITCKAG